MSSESEGKSTNLESYNGTSARIQSQPPLPPPVAPLPPPPPLPIPPPPQQSFIQSSQPDSNLGKALVCEDAVTSQTQEAHRALKVFCGSNRICDGDEAQLICVTMYKPAKPVIQNGPLCGMVALSMATELANGPTVSTEEIFNEAKKKGFSLQGELFSASDLCSLASAFLQCNTELIDFSQTDEKECAKQKMVEWLLKGHLVLVPYDADRNHSPCQKWGHKAHWALITGFFGVFKSSDFPAESLSALQQDALHPSLYFWNTLTENSIFCKMLTLVHKKSTDFFVLAHQGKSKHCGMWKLEDLLLSNENLVEIDPERNNASYVCPSHGLGQSLKNKVVLIHP